MYSCWRRLKNCAYGIDHARKSRGWMSGTEIILDFIVLAAICLFVWRILK